MSPEEILWERARSELSRRIASFDGAAGLCLLDLRTGARIDVNADTQFPAASTIKMYILAHLLERSEAREIDLTEVVTVDQGVGIPGSGVLNYLDDPVKLTRWDVATLMILVSDNTATNLCIDWATIQGTNAMVERLGLAQTILRRKMQDHQASADGLENLSTPGELVTFLQMLHERKGLTTTVCERTIDVLKRPNLSYMSVGLPDGVVVASKDGGMQRVRNDAGIVYLERRPYAVCFMSSFATKGKLRQEAFLVDTIAWIHEFMVGLDESNVWGQGIPATTRGTLS